MADYGHRHRQLRKHWEPIVATGEVPCARCGELIDAEEPWDLGHTDDDTGDYNGPEHRGRCNRRAGGEKRARMWTQPADNDRWQL